MNNQDNTKRNSFDLREFISICKIRWKWYAVAIAFGLVVGCYFYLKSYPTSTVSAKILMYDDASAATGASLVKQFSIGGLIGGSGAVDDEIKVLESHSLMKQTAEQLDLNVFYSVKTGLLRHIPVYDNKVPVLIQFDKNIADTLSIGIGFKVKVSEEGLVDVEAKVKKKTIAQLDNSPMPATLETSYGNFTFIPTDAYVKGQTLTENITVVSYDGAAETYLKKVIASIPDKKSSLIELSIDVPDPSFGKILLDTLIANYNARGIEERRQRDLKTAELIERRLMILSEDLAHSEDAEEGFQKDQNLIDVKGQAEQLASKLFEFKQSIEATRIDIEKLEMIKDFLSNPDTQYDLLPFESAFTSSVSLASYNSLISNYNQKILERMKLVANAKGNNIVLRTFDDQLDAFRSNILLTIGNAYENAKRNYDELISQQREYQSLFSAMPSQIKDYRSLQRTQSVMEQLYLFLLQQREETEMTLQNGQPRAVIVDSAYVMPEPNEFGKIKLLMIIFFIGIVIPTGLIFVMELLRTKLGRNTKISNYTSTPLLADVEYNVKSNDIVVVNAVSPSALVEPFRTLRNNLRFILPDKDEKVVLVTSPRPDEDAPYVAVNTAAALSLAGLRVLLIEGDVRRPELAQALSLNANPGLADILADTKLPLDTVVQTVEGDISIDVITAGNLSLNTSELLSSQRMDEIIGQLRSEYDYVVLLSSPFSVVTDSYVLSHLADATIFVVRAGKTSICEFKEIEDSVLDERFNKPSIVRVNDFNPSKAQNEY